jgi:hypothetical protein
MTRNAQILFWALLACPLWAEDAAENDRPVSLKTFASNILDDQKFIWTFPARLAKGSSWMPTLAVGGITAGLVATDPAEGRYFRRNSSSYDRLNDIVTKRTSTTASLLVPAAFYVTGLIKKDPYVQRTGLLAAEAWIDAEIPNLAMRSAFRRTRPQDIDPRGNFSDTWFKAHGNPLNAKGSFPSGHTAWAFAVATVVARRHGNHKWVPIVAYGLAATVGFARMSSASHFGSDVFFGAALGYTVGRFVVLRKE